MLSKDNKYLGRLILLSFLFCLSPPRLLAADDLSEADTLFNLGGMENYKRSIELYLKALEATPDNYETKWKCARACREYGKKAKRQRIEVWKEICSKYGKAGIKYAQSAMEQEPNHLLSASAIEDPETLHNRDQE